MIVHLQIMQVPIQPILCYLRWDVTPTRSLKLGLLDNNWWCLFFPMRIADGENAANRRSLEELRRVYRYAPLRVRPLSFPVDESSSVVSAKNIAFAISFMNIFVILESGLLKKFSIHDIKCCFTLWTQWETICCKWLVFLTDEI